MNKFTICSDLNNLTKNNVTDRLSELYPARDSLSPVIHHFCSGL